MNLKKLKTNKKYLLDYFWQDCNNLKFNIVRILSINIGENKIVYDIVDNFLLSNTEKLVSKHGYNLPLMVFAEICIREVSKEETYNDVINKNFCVIKTQMEKKPYYVNRKY